MYIYIHTYKTMYLTTVTISWLYIKEIPVLVKMFVV